MGVCLCECIIEDVKAVKVNKQKMRGADTQELLQHVEPLIFLSHWISIVEQMRSSPIPSLNIEDFQSFGRIQTVILYFIKLCLVSKC